MTDSDSDSDSTEREGFRLLPEASPMFKRAIAEVPRRAFALDMHDQELTGHPAFSSTPDPDILALGRAARVAAAHRVLEVGTGTGYRAAVLGKIVSEVHTVESVKRLAEHARARYAELGYENVHVHWRDGLEGLEEHAPFDRIIVSVPSVNVPQKLKDQLAEGGALVSLVGDGGGRRILRVIRDGEEFHEELLSLKGDVLQLGDIVVEMGLVDRDSLEQVAGHRTDPSRRIGEELVGQGLLDETSLYRALAIQSGVNFGTAQQLLGQMERALYQSVSHAYLEHSHVLPIRREGGRLKVATTNPTGNFSSLAVALGASDVDVYLVTPSEFRRIWTALKLGKLPASGPVDEAPSGAQDRDLLADNAVDARMVAIFEAMLLDAVAERASDIHLEIYEQKVRVRFRIDGELHDINHYQLTPMELRGLINIIKINGGLDIAERRLPQGGRFRRRAGDMTFDLRVQTQPSLYGEHVIMRILPQDQHVLTIEELGFPPEIAKQYRRLLDSPGGLILVVGPTGSGKSTTLYAGLQVLARDATRKVITVEDPIEYSMKGIQQTQAKTEIGFAFANAMRAFVREDPDVILVGEIRDKETAMEAIRASQTGHLVLSTLHSNDAVDAVQRLFDLDMHANSIASELLAVIAQRLARRICKSCRQEVEPDPEIMAELFPDGDIPDDFETFRGAGCSVCDGRGTRGRIALLEFLRTDKVVRAAITRKVTVDELRDAALEAGLITMRDSALWLVQQGVVPLEELPRVLPAERMAPERPAADAPAIE
ncbi:MAG: ATPase, T2SS/T4P/T4SS family [Persicimonas sp.]